MFNRLGLLLLPLTILSGEHGQASTFQASKCKERLELVYKVKVVITYAVVRFSYIFL